MVYENLNLDEFQIVTLIGAGGKTSTMYYLAQRGVEAGKRVLITTTTKIFYQPQDHKRFIQADEYNQWLKIVQLRAKPGEYLVSGKKIMNGKIQGLEPIWIDCLAEKDIFDLILIEADGSAQKPLKAPANFEPVIPDSTELLLPVVGLTSLKYSLSSDIVHRLDKFMKLTGLKEGEQIDVADLYQIYLHPEGYDLKKKMEMYSVLPILNQADDIELEKNGLKLAQLFIDAGMKTVLITSHVSDNFKWRVVDDNWYNPGSW